MKTLPKVTAWTAFVHPKARRPDLARAAAILISEKLTTRNPVTEADCEKAREFGLVFPAQPIFTTIH